MRSTLFAIKVRRRILSVAIFSARSLEHVDSLQMCNEPEAVTDAAARFLASTVGKFRPDSAAIGTGAATNQGERVSTLLDLAETMLRAESIPFWQIKDQTVLESFAIPKLKNKGQLKGIVQSFWPYLNAKQLLAFEAIALGFYVQTDRLLSVHH